MNAYSVLEDLSHKNTQRLQSTECQGSHNFNEIQSLSYKDY